MSAPISNLVWVQAFFKRFGLDEIVRTFKTKGIDLAKLAKAMVAYKAITVSAPPATTIS